MCRRVAVPLSVFSIIEQLSTLRLDTVHDSLDLLKTAPSVPGSTVPIGIATEKIALKAPKNLTCLTNDNKAGLTL